MAKVKRESDDSMFGFGQPFGDDRRTVDGVDTEAVNRSGFENSFGKPLNNFYNQFENNDDDSNDD